jgi:hypothetical protein
MQLKASARILQATSIFSALLLPLGRQIEEHLPIHLGLLRALTLLVSFVTILFAATYNTLIEVKLGWHEVLAGSDWPLSSLPPETSASRPMWDWSTSARPTEQPDLWWSLSSGSTIRPRSSSSVRK